MAESAQILKPSILLLYNPAELKKVFDQFDMDKDGKLSIAELSTVMKAMGCSFTDAELKRIMGELDANNDGFVDMSEFESICRSTGNSAAADLRKAFDEGDKDKNGLLSADELQLVLGKLGITCTVEDCGRMIKSVDVNGDRNLDFEEFKKMMSKPLVEAGISA